MPHGTACTYYIYSIYSRPSRYQQLLAASSLFGARRPLWGQGAGYSIDRGDFYRGENINFSQVFHLGGQHAQRTKAKLMPWPSGDVQQLLAHILLLIDVRRAVTGYLFSVPMLLSWLIVQRTVRVPWWSVFGCTIKNCNPFQNKNIKEENKEEEESENVAVSSETRGSSDCMS